MNTDRLYTVLKGPHVSEKAVMGEDQIVFKVAIDATKLEVRKAVEKLFSVKVINVQTMKVKGKTSRNRFGLTKKSDWKKAIVRLEQGQDIDFASVE